MRIVLAALIGVFPAVTETQAIPTLGCKLDGLEQTTDALEGSGSWRFRVLKVESHFRRLHGPEVNDFKSDGYVKALVGSNGRRYDIVQTYSRYGLPGDCQEFRVWAAG